MIRMFSKYILVLLMISILSCTDTLYDAAFEGNIDKVQTLLEEGANINAKDEDGFAALHYATLEGHPDIVEILLENGADVNAKTKNGRTVLQFVESEGSTGIVQLLKDAGARE
jgi:ankyrin repeat protein